MKCEIVRDLMPSYIDGLTGDVTNGEIEKHLEECVICRQYYQEMKSAGFGTDTKEDEKDRKKSRDVLQKFRRVRLRWILISCAAVALVIAGFFWVTGWWIELPYDQVQVEAQNSYPNKVYLGSEEGEEQWTVSTGVMVTEKAGTYGFNYADFRYRTMTVDGEEKNAAFLSCQMTVRDYLFQREPVRSGDEAVWIQNGYEDKDFSNVDMIYYLDKGIDEIEDASEEEAQEMIETYGTLLWDKSEGE